MPYAVGEAGTGSSAHKHALSLNEVGSLKKTDGCGGVYEELCQDFPSVLERIHHTAISRLRDPQATPCGAR